MGKWLVKFQAPRSGTGGAIRVESINANTRAEAIEKMKSRVIKGGAKTVKIISTECKKP
ncbi:hypothetical protein ACYULU_02880 [Breznakiellaceae bacterium SP9]